MQIERRLSHRLVDYWQQIKGDMPLPKSTRVNPEDISDMWESCFVIRVGADGESGLVTFDYGYIGEAVQPLYIDAERGLQTLPPKKLHAFYEEMLMTNLPVVENVEEFPLGAHYVKCRQCLLPLTGKGGGITELLGGVRYKYI